MFALALLTISGTSLFMMQATIFHNVFQAHSKFIGALYKKKLQQDLSLKLFQLQQQKEVPANLSLKTKAQHSPITTTLSLQKISDKSALFKKFSETVYVAQQSTIFDSKQDKALEFIFIPPYNEENK